MKTATYINRKIYTDVESWLITDIDEKKGTATATPVKKTITPNIKVGGFLGHCTNLSDFDNAKPEVSGASFPITRNNKGEWGFRRPDIAFFAKVAALNPDWLEQNRNNPGVEIDGEDVRIYNLTKSGKVKTSFEVLGTFEKVCRYFYDFNF